MSANPWELKVPQGGGDFPAALPADNYPAVLVALVDLGTQENDYQGSISYRRELFLAWEVPGEAGAPVLGRAFAASLSPKASLTKWLTSLTADGKIPPEGVDLQKLLGKACLLEVLAESKKTDGGERTYNRLNGVSRLPRGLAVPKATRTPVVVGLRDDVPGWLPRSYGRLLADVRADSVEENGRTRARFEDWKRAKQKAPAPALHGGPLAGGPDGGPDGAPDGEGDDDIPF